MIGRKSRRFWRILVAARTLEEGPMASKQKRKRRASYDLCVKFRGSRLALRRGLTSLEQALSIADELRANRFHDHESLIVVMHPGGEAIDEQAARAALREGATRGEHTPRPPRDPSQPPPPPEDITTIAARLEHLREVRERVSQMRKRCDTARAAADLM